MGISLQIAQGVGTLFVGSLFYGLYLPSLFFCLKCLLWDENRSALRSAHSIHWIILLSALTLWASGTLNVALGLLRSVRAFVQCTEPDASVQVFDDVSDWVNVTRAITTFIAIFVGDGILIYRCWIVWGRNHYVTILPLLLYLANLSCVIVIIWKEVNVNAASVVEVNAEKAWFLANTALTIPLNVITTSFIVFRIWSVDHQNWRQFSRGARPTALKNVMRIIVESGLLYTASAIISFCTYIVNSNAFYIATSLEVQITGIAFNLIVIRAHKQSQDEYTIPQTNASVHFWRVNHADSATHTTSPGDVTETEEKVESPGYRGGDYSVH